MSRQGCRRGVQPPHVTPPSPTLPFIPQGGTLVCGLAAYGAGVSEWGATFDSNLFSLIADPLWLPQVWEKKHRADGSGGARKLRTQKAGLDRLPLASLAFGGDNRKAEKLQLVRMDTS